MTINRRYAASFTRRNEHTRQLCDATAFITCVRVGVASNVTYAIPRASCSYQGCHGAQGLLCVVVVVALYNSSGNRISQLYERT